MANNYHSSFTMDTKTVNQVYYEVMLDPPMPTHCYNNTGPTFAKTSTGKQFFSLIITGTIKSPFDYGNHE